MTLVLSNWIFTIYSSIFVFIGLLILIFHLRTRTLRLILTMKESVPGSLKWFIISNIINHYFTIYDHCLSIITTIMIILNNIICIILLIYSIQYNINININNNNNNIYNIIILNNNNNCSIYIYTIHICYILSNLLYYIYIILLVKIITNDTGYENIIKKYLKYLYILLFIFILILIFFGIYKIIPFNNCIYFTTIYFKIIFILIYIIMSIILLFLLIKPLKNTALNVHKRLTSLRADPLHRAMWKYILIMSFICIINVILLIIPFITYSVVFSYFIVFTVNVSNSLVYIIIILINDILYCI